MSGILKELGVVQKLPRWFVSLSFLVTFALLSWIFTALIVPYFSSLHAKVDTISERTISIDEKMNGQEKRITRIEGQVDQLQSRK